MIQNDDGTVTLEKGEVINLEKEIQWIVNDWLPDERYHGALIFRGGGRSAGYILFPYEDPNLRQAG